MTTPAQRPSPARMIGRGLVKRCPLCGSGGLFTGRFRMRGVQVAVANVSAARSGGGWFRQAA